MIPHTHYYPARGFEYITKRLFLAYHSVQEWGIFDNWLFGQTGGLVDGEVVIYSWDYERWIRQGKKTEQGADWD
jgi:hypothetical protein